MTSKDTEAARLEELWAGEFGHGYIDRNIDAAAGRETFWRERLSSLDVATALEVGCNVGGNLRWLAEALGPQHVTGVDVNERALEMLRESVPGVNAVCAAGRSLPFADSSFDLAFTIGVLIHQPSETLRSVMSEIVRCSRRYVLCGEYAASDETEVEYRGEHGALFRRDYGGLYRRWFPELHEIETGFLDRASTSFDDVTFWVFEKR